MDNKFDRDNCPDDLIDEFEELMYGSDKGREACEHANNELAKLKAKIKDAQEQCPECNQKDLIIENLKHELDEAIDMINGYLALTPQLEEQSPYTREQLAKWQKNTDEALDAGLVDERNGYRRSGEE